jgi:uncharacterized protein (UPF0264 family)
MPNPSAALKIPSTELLVSVRSEAELITIAASECVSIVDLKEPANGPLAPASVDLWHTAADLIAKAPAIQPAAIKTQALSAALSAALGEFEEAMACAADLPAQFSFAKMGASNCDHPKQLHDRWSRISRQLPSGPELVAVAYADFQAAKSLPPQTVLETAIDHGLRRILIDTFRKDGRSSIHHLGIDAIKQFASTAAQSRMWWSLAGSISLQQIDLIAANQLHPDCIGIRTAACIGARTSEVSIEKCQQLHRHLCKIQRE